MNKADFIEKVENTLDYLRNDPDNDVDADPADWLDDFEFLLDRELDR